MSFKACVLSLLHIVGCINSVKGKHISWLLHGSYPGQIDVI